MAVEMLATKQAQLQKQLTEAAIAGDMAKVDTIRAEQKKLEKAEFETAVSAESDARTRVQVFIANGVKGLDMKTLLDGALLTGIVKRDEDGKFTDYSVILSPSNKTTITSLLTPIVDRSGAGEIASITRLELTAEGVIIHTKGARKANGGTGGSSGKGWSKNGTSHKLGEVFEMHKETVIEYQKESMTGAEALEIVKTLAPSTSGGNIRGATDTVMRKVAAANGYHLNS